MRANTQQYGEVEAVAGDVNPNDVGRVPSVSTAARFWRGVQQLTAGVANAARQMDVQQVTNTLGCLTVAGVATP